MVIAKSTNTLNDDVMEAKEEGGPRLKLDRLYGNLCTRPITFFREVL